jgi:glucose-6-phosphate-specific signal transduction histidine kinase
MKGPAAPHSASAPASRLGAGRDAGVVVAVTIQAFLVASRFELQEQFTRLTQPFERFQADELMSTLLALAVALAWFAWRRWHQATRELDQRLAVERELVAALAENRRLAQQYLLAQEEERRSLARELHDELGQCLNAIKLDATTIRDHPLAPPHDVVQSAQAIIDVSSRVYDVTRGLMERLRPVGLDELGLADALRHLVSEWQRRNPGVNCTLELRGRLDALSEQLNISLYRVVQECLTNVARHARAATVEVRVEGPVNAHDDVHVGVRDDGVGISAGAGGRAGLGLAGLRERVEALGGRFEVADRAPHGAEIRAQIPVAPEAGA